MNRNFHFKASAPKGHGTIALERSPKGNSFGEYSAKEMQQPRYEGIQCIGFTVGTEHDSLGYRGLEDDSEDLNARIRMFCQGLTAASRNDSINRNPHCLKIFMVPEFFFRGSKGAYPMEIASTVSEKLRDVVNSPEYKDWLFVFGTTTGYAHVPEQKVIQFEAYNFAVVQKGNGGEKDAWIVLKEHKSPADFMEQEYDVSLLGRKLDFRNTRYLQKLNKHAQTDELKEVSYDGKAVFQVGGIRMGLEICLDHIRERINRAKELEHPLDVLLVTSCGLARARRSNKMGDKGITFICDGKHRGYSLVVDREKQTIPFLQKNKIDLLKLPEGKRIFATDEGYLTIFATVNLKKNYGLEKE